MVNFVLYVFYHGLKKNFKGLDLIEYLKNYGWRFMTLDRRQ